MVNFITYFVLKIVFYYILKNGFFFLNLNRNFIFERCQKRDTTETLRKYRMTKITRNEIIEEEKRHYFSIFDVYFLLLREFETKI